MLPRHRHRRHGHHLGRRSGNVHWPERQRLDSGLGFPRLTAQLEAFAEAWATVGADYRPYGYMWVGFTRETGEWANLDGVPISLYSNVWREGHPHDMNMYVYIEDVTMTSGSESRGRFYASCTMTDALQRALCRAYPQK
nr:uncharacterized protein LOC113810037 isoform X2 [Penaeus vannamei]